MPKRRTYGYTEQNPEQKQTKTSGYAGGGDRNNGLRRPARREYGDMPLAGHARGHGRNTRTGDSTWVKLLMIPLKTAWLLLVGLFAILKFCWRLFGGLRKSASAETKQRLVWGAIGLAVFGFIFATVSIAWMSRDLPDPDKLTDRKVAESTKIYDRTGEHMLYEIFTDKRRTVIEYDEIPQQLINAVIATEDTKFYEHSGVRPLSILRAAVVGIFTSRRIGGTSTLTQQLVKNAILTNERSITRKIKEIILSVRLEQKYNKEQILKIYFNEIPYGSTNYGVEAAAQNYYGKSVKDLGLAQLAALGGLPKAPSTYLRNKEALKARRDFVLRRMFEEGFITEEEKVAAQAEPVTLEQKFDNITAPHFVLYVKEQLVEMFGENMVNTGGLRVITTLDWEKQKAAEKAVEEVGVTKLEAAGANNTALVALDPKNGNILAMVGSADFFNDEIDGQFNVATQGLRQPGSSFKPIVYAAAFEKGYTPDTVLYDVITDFAVNGQPYKPLNYNLKELGPVSMRQALQGSLNIPAVKTLYLVGAQKGIDFAERLGYTTLSEGSFGLSLVLGGGEVKLLEHVAAYSVFADQGVKHDTVSVLQVEDGSGQELYKYKEKRGERVLDKEITAAVSNVLSDDSARAFAFGAGGALTLPGRPVAAKTGTTNAYVDAWTVGYTPSLVAGVWAGNTNNTAMKRAYGGSSVAAPIWKAFMTEALKNAPVEQFPAPPANDAQKPILRGGEGGNITLNINSVTGRIATSSTPDHVIVQRSYVQPHSILHYVQKDDPRGESPKNPENDPQYGIWEAAITDWINRKRAEDPNWDVSFEEPPTEMDSEYSMELLPTLEVVYPQENATLFTRQIDTDIRAGAPRGVTKVSYKIDDAWVGVVREHPFNLNYYAGELADGAHTLTISVEDDIGNRLQKEIPFTLQAGEEKPGAVWIDANGSTFSRNDFPRTFLIRPIKVSSFKSLMVIGEHDGNARTFATITDFTKLFDGQIQFNWSGMPKQGDWTLKIKIQTTDSATYNGQELKIKVE